MRLILDRSQLLMKFINQYILSFRFNRFLLVGSVNTAVTYIIYIIGTFIFNYLTAYTISYLLGIVISYYLNSSYVFNSSVSINKSILFFGVYFIQYIIGLVLLYWLVDLLLVNKALAPWGVMFVNVPLTYFLTKTVLQEKACV